MENKLLCYQFFTNAILLKNLHLSLQKIRKTLLTIDFNFCFKAFFFTLSVFVFEISLVFLFLASRFLSVFNYVWDTLADSISGLCSWRQFFLIDKRVLIFAIINHVVDCSNYVSTVLLIFLNFFIVKSVGIISRSFKMAWHLRRLIIFVVEFHLTSFGI